MVGGAPVTEAYARQIGADGFAPDASQAAKKAKALLDS
jgi:5-methyltetrahydrofolate--homocysteine methyltransferase